VADVVCFRRQSRLRTFEQGKSCRKRCP
jgi:hypothetical protein